MGWEGMVAAVVVTIKTLAISQATRGQGGDDRGNVNSSHEGKECSGEEEDSDAGVLGESEGQWW